MSLTPFQADDIYCVYCHAKAIGPCARCRALICADCGDLAQGTVTAAVVCHDCVSKGARKTVGLGFWLGLLWPVLLIAAIVAGLVIILR